MCAPACAHPPAHPRRCGLLQARPPTASTLLWWCVPWGTSWPTASWVSPTMSNSTASGKEGEGLESPTCEGLWHFVCPHTLSTMHLLTVEVLLHSSFCDVSQQYLVRSAGSCLLCLLPLCTLVVAPAPCCWPLPPPSAGTPPPIQTPHAPVPQLQQRCP